MIKLKFKNNIVVLLLTLFFILCFSFITLADWVHVEKGFMYMNNATNQYVYNNWLQTGNGYYYLDNEGLAVKGWYLINGKYYFFGDDGLMLTGFKEIDGKTYYLDLKSGQMAEGWVQVYDNGDIYYYYFGDNGAMNVGWKEIEKKWYYFNEGKALIDTWAKINNVWYHFNTGAQMDTGWITVQNKMYYLSPADGSMMKGWIQDQQGNEYYLSEYDGSLVVSTTITINGISYTFDQYGRCVSRGQYQLDQTGNIYTAPSGQQYVSGPDGTSTYGSGSGYNVTVGMSPAANAGAYMGVSSTGQQFINSQEKSLTPGSTVGPK